MGRVSTKITVTNKDFPDCSVTCRAVADSGSSLLTFPAAWKERLGSLEEYGTIKAELADQTVIDAQVYGPVRIEIPGFRTINGEVVFVEMEPNRDGNYEPLIGCIPLEQAQAAIDVTGHRLIRSKFYI